MGTIYRRDDSRFWWLDFVGPDGHRHQRSSKKTDEAQARALLVEIEAALASRSPDAPAPLSFTVASWTARWAQRRVEKDKWTNAKLDARALQQHVAQAVVEVHGQRIAFGKLRLEEVRVLHVRRWLEAMESKKLAPNTILSTYSLLNRALKAAVADEVLTVNPCASLERGELPRLADNDPDARPEDAMFSLTEVERLVSDSRIPLDRRVGYAVTLLGGLRQGELAALTWADYDPTQEPLGRLYVSKSYTRRNKRVKSTKSGAARLVPVHAVTAKLLGEWRLSGWQLTFGRRPAPSDLLIPNRAGRHLTDLNLWGNLQQDLKTLGLKPRRFHDTKATFCTYAIAAGSPWEVVKHISHGVKQRSRNMSQVYVRPPWTLLCDVVARIKLQLRGDAEVVPLQATGSDALRSGVTVDAGDDATSQRNSGKSEVPRARFEPSARSVPSGSRKVASGASVAEGDPSRSAEVSERNADVTFPSGDDHIALLAELLELGAAGIDPEHSAMKRAAEALPEHWRAKAASKNPTEES